MIGRAARIGVAVVAASVAVTLAASAMSGASVPKRAHGTSAVRAARNATRTFHNLQRGQNAGYGFFTDKKGIACIAMKGMGGMGVHFVKGALVGDLAERVRQPEALVYRIDANGKLVLSALEYVVLKSAWDAKHSSRPSLFGHRFNFTPAGNRFGLPAYYSLHAWIWYSNPAGMFSMWNPRVKC
jgi:hypothetical protein